MKYDPESRGGSIGVFVKANVLKPTVPQVLPDTGTHLHFGVPFYVAVLRHRP